MKLKVKLGESFKNKHDIELYQYCTFWYFIDDTFYNTKGTTIHDLSLNIITKLNINSSDIHIFVEDIFLPKWENIVFLKDGDSIVIEKKTITRKRKYIDDEEEVTSESSEIEPQSPKKKKKKNKKTKISNNTDESKPDTKVKDKRRSTECEDIPIRIPVKTDTKDAIQITKKADINKDKVKLNKDKSIKNKDKDNIKKSKSKSHKPDDKNLDENGDDDVSKDTPMDITPAPVEEKKKKRRRHKKHTPRHGNAPIASPIMTPMTTPTNHHGNATNGSHRDTTVTITKESKPPTEEVHTKSPPRHLYNYNKSMKISHIKANFPIVKNDCQNSSHIGSRLMNIANNKVRNPPANSVFSILSNLRKKSAKDNLEAKHEEEGGGGGDTLLNGDHKTVDEQDTLATDTLTTGADVSIIEQVNDTRYEPDEPEPTPDPLDAEFTEKFLTKPCVGDIIIYKTLEMSMNYCPEVSSYKKGKIIGEENGLLQIEPILGVNAAVAKMTNGDEEKALNKFDVVMENEEGDILTNVVPPSNQVIVVAFASLIDPLRVIPQ